MSFMVRMSILGTLLLVALCGLAWEYLVAVPGFNNAQSKLTKLSDSNIRKTADEAMTMADVKQILPQKPSNTKVVSPPKKKSEDDTMRSMFFLRHDTYNFYHALPWKKPETITVVYKRTLMSEDELDKDVEGFEDKEWLFWSVHINTEPPPTAQRSVSRDAVNPGDSPVAGGAGGGGGGGRSRPNPEEIFKEADKDEDGKLTGDEISDRMKSRMDTIDSDKDGAITLEEMKAAFSQRGGQKKGKSNRPPTDDENSKTKAKSEDEAGKSEAKAEEKTETKAPEKSEAKAEEKKAVEKKAVEDSDAKSAEKSEKKPEAAKTAEPEKKTEKSEAPEKKVDSAEKTKEAEKKID